MQARCDRALRVVVCCSSDAVNLDVVAACARLVEEPTWTPATVQVLIETSGLWARLQLATVNARRGRELLADFAHLPELAGRALIGAMGSSWLRPGTPCELVVVAETSTGRWAAVHAVRLARAASSDVRLVLAGDDPETDAQRLCDEAPWIEQYVSVAGSAPDGASDRGADGVIVCCADEAAGLTLALELADLGAEGAPIIANVTDDRLLESLRAADIELGSVTPVGAEARVLSPDFLLTTTIESIARARHEAYLRMSATSASERADNSSLVGWDVLPESLKESNRRFAASVGAKVSALGGRIVPVEPGEHDPPKFELVQGDLDDLAREEHERWVDDLRADGWRATQSAKDPERRLHPLLVPWDELPEAEREKDRDSIRSLPMFLASAGFAIRLREAEGRASTADSSELGLVAGP